MHLVCVGLAVNDPEEVARRFERDFGLPRSATGVGEVGFKVPFLRVGACAIALHPVGEGLTEDTERPRVHHLVMSTPHADAAINAASARGITAGDSVVLNGTRAVPLDREKLGGVRLFVCSSFDLPADAQGPVERIDHIGVASANNVPILDAFCRRLGCALESQQTDLEVATAVESFTSDKYGVVRHSRPAKLIGGLKVAFVNVGECELEFLQNFDPCDKVEIHHGAAGTTKQDQGAITRFIEKNGAGLHHIALKTPNVDATLAHLADNGHRLIDQVGRPGSRRARIGFVHPASFGGVLLHFVEREEIYDSSA